MNIKYLNKESGISLNVLVITVVIMMILTTVVTINFQQYGEQVKKSHFSEDMTMLNEEVSQYYSKNKELPIINKFTNTSSFSEVKNPNDDENYFVIDLDKLNLKLNYGKDYDEIRLKSIDEEITSLTDVYIINNLTHTIYYPKGIEVNGVIYYKIKEDFTEVTLREVLLDPEITITMQSSSDYLFAIKSVVQIDSFDVENIDLTQSKYVYTESSEDINDASEYTDGYLTGLTTTIEESLPAGTWYLHVLLVDKDGNSTVETSSTAITVAETAEFDYYEENGHGAEQTASLLPGIYKLECWGAQGGDTDEKQTVAYGGYATGIINTNVNETLYINVGEKGDDFKLTGISYGGYNGGGNGGADTNASDPYGGSGGGGATHIATESGVLSDLDDSINSIYIVAGGGGGWGEPVADCTLGGAGGGFIGNDGGYSNSFSNYYATGGTQLQGGIDNQEGGIRATFGQGGNFCSSTYGGNGGGGGFYGGGGSSRCHSGGGGGSGYIGNSALINKHMTGYNVSTTNDVDAKTITTTNVSATAVSDYAKQGNGYARITNLNPKEISYTIPTMTNNTTTVTNYGTMIATSSSLYQAGAEPYKAFDHLIDQGTMEVWHSSNSTPQWLQLQLPVLTKITDFAIKNRDWSGRDNVSSFKLYGSYDGINWDQLNSEYTNPVDSNVTTEFTVESPGYYYYYKWSITGTRTGYAVIDEIYFRQAYK